MTGPAAIRWTPWQVRAGWLLRAHRLCHADASRRELPGFAQAYREGHRGAAGTSPSSLSRWETGRVPVVQEAVRRYERVLGLPAYSLLAPIQTIARHEGGPAAAAFLRGGSGPAVPDGADPRFESLLDRALDGGVLTGGDWERLSRWAVHGGGHVSPGRVRSAVVRRLLEETLVSGGVSWMRRFESLGRLMADPRWGPEVIAVCSGAAEQSDHAGLIEVVCALDGSPHPDAGRAVLRQLTDPTTPDSLYGALLAAARKTRKRHFGAEQTRTLVDLVDGVLTSGPGPGLPPPALEAASVLLASLPLAPAHAARLTRAAAGRGGVVRAVVTHGSLTDPASASVVVGRLLARLAGDVPKTTAGVLSGLLDDLLHHPVADMRLYAAILLRASPYGSGVAAALAAEIGQPGTLRAEDRAVPLLHALRVLGGPGQREVVAGLTLARGLPAGVVLAAVHALGHIGGHSPESYWRAVFDQHTRATTADPAGQHGVMKRLVYGFAMAGELPLLTRLVEEQDRAASAQHLSRWWTGLAHHISDSARRG
ncbi:hypothetical protein ACIPPM_04055 [Streptomyces sp. NPDC090119]|uniref:hypothetical protein n=1 Tax=Streptomyces sp. NPDC090119 TaxID=3365951 RepID=UPI003804EEC6